jgi:hypothetical protein
VVSLYLPHFSNLQQLPGCDPTKADGKAKLIKPRRAAVALGKELRIALG